MVEINFEKPRPSLIKARPRLRSNFIKGSDGEYISLGVDLGVEETVTTDSFFMERTRHFPGCFDDKYVDRIYRLDVWLLSTLLLNADHFGKEMHEVLYI